MKILLTGATGYIGQRLLPELQEKGHTVVCCVRDKQRFDTSKFDSTQLQVIEVDFLQKETLDNIPTDIDAAYYLIHSMSSAKGDFQELEAKTAENFRDRIQQTSLKHVVYLSGIVNEKQLSKHLSSRKNVEAILSSGEFHLTTLRAGIIVGEGSASFEIIRDLVEKLPVMIAPRWLKTKSQPIAVSNVIEFLQGVLMKEETFDKDFDIGGPEVLTYGEMLLKFAKVRNLRRIIIHVPVMTPRLSSYWLYFVTSTSYKLATNLVDSMKVEVIARENNLHKKLGIELLTYEEAVKLAFDHIARHEIPSRWTDAMSSKVLQSGISKLTEVPAFGCFKDKREQQLQNEQQTLENIWAIGGENGWYYANWLWGIRGFLDKLSGGVGLRRGRKNADQISAGETLDFWRVIYANRAEKRLLLYAEMKLPGEAWLEFKINDNILYQTATFRPHGLWGRVYWFSVLPFHGFIFKGMINKIAQ
ncbi:MAG: SDR family oxidoreductase [Bacteroidales bacterium]|nr:SDR family oxidoreductase [Bacteroidales bacterium]